MIGNDDGDEDGDGDDDDGLVRSDISGLAMKSICRVMFGLPCWPAQLTRSSAPRDLSSPPSHIHLPCQPHIPSTRPSASLASAI